MSVIFDNGANYAKHRPTYPDELAGLLAAQSATHRLAVDVGCGTGQLTEALTSEYATVLGADISPSQLRAASGDATYIAGDAVALPIADGAADLVTVAQAAHWIDLDAFYTEARRIAAPGAVIALVSYGLCVIDDAETDRTYQEFYQGEFHDYWDERRIHVETGMRHLPFPFTPVKISCPDILREWKVQDFTAYIDTWSATANARRDGHEALFTGFADSLELVWGNRTLTVRWPVVVRAGLLE